MPIFNLDESCTFPHPELSEPDGLLAIGGDLSPKRLLVAYCNGIFPWYNEDDPILWWSLNPRLLLFPANFKTSKSLKQTLNSNKFEVRFDTDFEAVIHNCSTVCRNGCYDTWITDEVKDAYTQLYKLGFAHSVETYYNDELVGGLYGVSLGGFFSGESMFHTMRDASKVALHALVQKITEWGFDFVDAQQPTDHLKSMGAEEIERKEFLDLLEMSLTKQTIRGRWYQK